MATVDRGTSDEGEYVKYADPADRDTLRELIGLVRPAPVADENGDKHCLRLWPVAKCSHVSGHYGGCNTP